MVRPGIFERGSCSIKGVYSFLPRQAYSKTFSSLHTQEAMMECRRPSSGFVWSFSSSMTTMS